MNKENKYIVKGDLSGIQNFIFNIPSKGAAKELKRRSLYVTNLAEELLLEDEEFFKKNDFKQIYIGGGNYFYEVKTDKNEEELTEYFEQKSEKYILSELFPFFAFVKYTNSFQQTIQKVNKQMLKNKQQRLISLESFEEKNKIIPKLKDGEGINYHYPKDDSGEPIDFDHIAERGKGDPKLAALKLDIDQLGNIFREQSESDYKIL